MIYNATILISKRDFFLFVFPGMIGVIITIILFVRLIYFWRKFSRELQQRYPEVVEERKKYWPWLFVTSPLLIFINPYENENEKIDDELVALKNKAFISFFGMMLAITLGGIVPSLFVLILN